MLAQSTRRRVFALLSDLGRAAPTAELAGRLGLHPNGVRTHLASLHEAGLVVRRQAAGRRGRPRDEWAVSPTTNPGDAVPRADGLLARWLARAIPPTASRLREVERTGRAIGHDLAPADPPSLVEGMGDTLSALGFRPDLELDGHGRMRCRLDRCPYRDSVRENQPVVCTLHRGLTLGLLDRLAPSARLVAFVPHEPDTAGCEIEVDGLPPVGAAT